MRRLSRLSAKLVALVIVFVFAVVVFAPPAGAGRPPPCKSVWITLTFWFYSSADLVWFNGAYYQTGSTASILSGCGQTYPIQVGSLRQYAFLSWASDAGYFDSQTAVATNFHAMAAGDAAITMVLDLGTSNWGGYETENSATLITQASGSFTLPSTFTYVSAPEGKDDLSVWVGIGGRLGSMNLWQAGVYISTTPSGTSIYPVMEEILGDSSCCGAYIFRSNYPISPGDSIKVTLNAPSGAYPSFTLSDLNQKWKPLSVTCDPANYPGYCMTTAQFQPNTWTGEWIAEAPYYSTIYGPAQYTVPAFSPAVSFGLNAISTNAYPHWAMSLGRDLGFTGNGNQCLVPSATFSYSSYSASGAWSIAYRGSAC